MAVHVIDTPKEVVSLLNDIDNQPKEPPSLHVDIEGVNLSRHGSISIILTLQRTTRTNCLL